VGGNAKRNPKVIGLTILWRVQLHFNNKERTEGTGERTKRGRDEKRAHKTEKGKVTLHGKDRTYPELEYTDGDAELRFSGSRYRIAMSQRQ